MLAIDVGNSRIKFGLFEADACRRSARQLPACLETLASSVTEEIPWSEIIEWCVARAASDVHGVTAGANPQGIARVIDTWPSLWRPPEAITDPSQAPIATRLLFPRRVGIDRVLNAVAANLVRQVGEPILIIDSGTATTVDLVGADGAFEGGAILPGFELGARSLHFYTALLPRISMDELTTESNDPLGRETRAALRSGLYWGQVGAVRELASRISSSVESESSRANHTLSIILTGGGMSLLSPHFPKARCERFLSLQGLALSSQRAAA